MPGLLLLALRVEANTQDVHTWLPGGTSARAEYDRFVELFGDDDDIVISWDGCTTEDPRLFALTKRLRERVGDDLEFCGAANGRDVLNRLTSSGGAGLTEQQARERMAGVFFGEDGRTTGVCVRLGEAGRDNRMACFEKIYESADEVDGLGRERLRIGGGSFISVQIHKATNQALSYSVPAGLLAVLVTFFSLRSIRLTTITLSVAATSALVSVAFVTFCGYKINGLLVMMPVIVMVLTLSGGVHLAGYYRKAVRFDPFGDAVASMFKVGWRPCALATITTSVGILMLCTSHIEAVRHFGMFTSIGLMLALCMLLLTYPALLRVWPISMTEIQRFTSDKPTEIESRAQDHIVQRPWLATAGVAVVLCLFPALMIGAARLKTTLSPENMFPPDSAVRVNHDWLEENLTPVQCVEIVATFENDERDRLTSQIHSLHQIQQHLSELPEIRTVFSFASLCDPIPQGRGFRSVSRRSFINSRLRQELPNLMDQRLLIQEDNLTHWRIRVGLNIQDEEQYATLMDDIAFAAKECSADMETEPEFLVTGIWPLSAIGRQQLFSDLAMSFMLAFLMITPLIMLILRGVSTGLVAMIPNVFPALLFFGGMGWLGWSVDIGTILTASVGLGIAVDDTLHFLETYVRTRETSTCRRTAVWRAITHCGRPMLYTTLICCAGLAVFSASQFIPARQFAIAIVVLLGIALVSDLLLLPALILGPFGRLFDRRQKSDDADATPKNSRSDITSRMVA